MKISQITARDVALYLRLIPEDLTDEETNEIENFLEAAKEYVCSYTGLSAAECDEKKDLSVAVYILCQDFYDNRCAYTVSSQSPSKMLEAILALHCKNFL